MWFITQFILLPIFVNNKEPSHLPGDVTSTASPHPILSLSPTSTPSPQIPENMVRIRNVKLISISKDIHSIKLSVEVEYNYGEELNAVVALHGNYVTDSDSLFSFGGDTEQVIEKGHGKILFNIEVSYFEKDELLLKAYIHPFPQPMEWIPITESEVENVDLKRIVESNMAG